MAQVERILPHYVYDDWVRWEGQWELIEGIPYAMSPLPVPKHQMVAGNLLSEFRQNLKKCEGCKVYQPLDYLIKEDTIVQPDMLVVCGEIKKKFLDFPPELVVEILSPSTALKDRHYKFSLYQSQQIKYYLIISADTEEIEIYVNDTEYRLAQKGRDFKFTFSFDDIF